MAEGAFSGLPGEGRPLAPERLAGDDDHWAAFNLMKNERLIPPWSHERIVIEAALAGLRRRVAAHREWLVARAERMAVLPAERILASARAAAREDARVRVAIAAEVASLNERVARYNAMVPSERLALLPLSADALLA